MLRTAGVVDARWGRLEDAIADLWPRRHAHGPEPWAIGWISYEAAAELAGGLPHRPPAPLFPHGRLLLEPSRAGCLREGPPAVDSAVTSSFVSSLDAAAFEAGVAEVRRRIAAGDVYQVNLTRRFTLAPWSGDGRRLLDTVGDPVPEYTARIRDGGVDLVCASMELLLRRRGERVETRPIKGTRRRGSTPSEDRALAAELASDPKEAAELAMVVDLERNDLGIVAVPGSVVVADPGSVCSYGTVHHRVATVRATVDPAVPWWRVVAAVAPGGSVTGCPKRAAMGVIADLEPVPRGPFTGVLGVVTGNGGLELALPIRTAWVAAGRLELAAGCGIVWDSDPRREEAESRLKVARWLELEGVPA